MQCWDVCTHYTVIPLRQLSSSLSWVFNWIRPICHLFLWTFPPCSANMACETLSFSIFCLSLAGEMGKDNCLLHTPTHFTHTFHLEWFYSFQSTRPEVYSSGESSKLSLCTDRYPYPCSILSHSSSDAPLFLLPSRVSPPAHIGLTVRLSWGFSCSHC